MTRILVVEDEVSFSDPLSYVLTKEGYEVAVAETGPAALAAFEQSGADLVLLDVMLPGLDGYAVLQELRRGKHVPVLMLTARDEVEDRVRGLQAGADDYLVKPFALSELLARVQALLRRGALRSDSQDSTVLRLADLELDLVRRKASRSGQRLDLTAKEFTLLTLLLRRQGQVLSRTALAAQVWDMNFDSNTNVVEVAVRRLRGKIDDAFEKKLLHTVRGMGYVLEDRKP